MSATASLEAKRAALERMLAGWARSLVAFSGGVDSAYLAVRAHRVLGRRALAVTADSASLADAQRALARDVARRFGFAHRVVAHARARRTRSTPATTRTAATTARRELFRHLVPLAAARGLRARGLRPDRRRPLGLPPGPSRRGRGRRARARWPRPGWPRTTCARCRASWGCPPATCPPRPASSSRVPYGTPVTPEALRAGGAGRGGGARARLPRAARAPPGRRGARGDRVRTSCPALDEPGVREAVLAAPCARRATRR